LKETDERAGEGGADKGADDGNRCVGPIGITFTRDGKNSVGNARAQVSRGIDGISRGAAEGETDGPDKNANKIRADAGSHGADGFCRHGDGNEYEDEGANDLGDKVGESVAYGGRGAEDAQLEIRVSGFFPMRKILEPDENSTGNGAEKLRRNVER
jgi:hypothetical protein